MANDVELEDKILYDLSVYSEWKQESETVVSQCKFDISFLKTTSSWDVEKPFYFICVMKSPSWEFHDH